MPSLRIVLLFSRLKRLTCAWTVTPWIAEVSAQTQIELIPPRQIADARGHQLDGDAGVAGESRRQNHLAGWTCRAVQRIACGDQA